MGDSSELIGKKNLNAFITKQSELRSNDRGVRLTKETRTIRTHVAILFHRLGPYHMARLKAAARKFRITAIEFSNIDATYEWERINGQEGFNRTTLFPDASSESQSGAKIFEAVKATLGRVQPEVVAIPGWYDRCSLAGLQWCATNSVPAVMMSESNGWDEKRNAIREHMKSRLVRLCAAGLAGGEGHSDYLQQLGIPPGRIGMGYDIVDNEYFERTAIESKKQKTENRDRFGLPEKYFLASARFVGKKNLVRLLEAYACYRRLVENVKSGKRQTEPWSLVLLGDGPLRSELEARIADLGLQASVTMPGFRQYGELPIYYGLASAFVHASTTEQWGLVVNEAMASGLPVLVSNRCGCAGNLVKEGVNGFTFDPLNVEQLAQLMLKVSAPGFPLSTFDMASKEIISKWGPERFAEGLEQAVRCALECPLPRPNFLDYLLLKMLISRRGE
jgi:1,2-diacylglycerol 3-alpha-glucosyltransferase